MQEAAAATIQQAMKTRDAYCDAYSDACSDACSDAYGDAACEQLDQVEVACAIDVRAADECGAPPQALLRLLSPKFPGGAGGAATRGVDCDRRPPRTTQGAPKAHPTCSGGRGAVRV